jgi:WD40 repeat protein
MELKNLARLNGHDGSVWSLSWSSDPCNGAEHMIASSGDDSTIVWHCMNSKWEVFKVTSSSLVTFFRQD